MASNFNDTTPAAPAGNVNVKWQTDGAGNDSAYVPAVAGGGTNEKTTSYTLLAGDAGKNVVANSGSSLTFTLPASPPSATWSVFIENIGAGTLTLDPNGLDLDGSASTLSIPTDSGVYVSTDNTNYFTERGLSSGGFANPMTTLGDIITGGASGTPTRLGIGSTSDVLTVVGGVPAWAPASGGGGSFGNFQRQALVSADGVSTTLQQVGENLSTTFGASSPAAKFVTATTNAAVEYQPASGPAQLVIFSSEVQYVVGKNLKMMFDFYITTTGDNFSWIMISTQPGNFFTWGRTATPAASSGANYVGFRCQNKSGSSLETTWQAACGDGATDTITPTGVTQDTNGHRFCIVQDDSVPNVQYFIDGVLVATNTTHLPTVGTLSVFYLSEWYTTTPPNVGFGQLAVLSDL